MTLIGLAGVLVGLGLLIAFAYRGWSVLLLAPIAALLAVCGSTHRESYRDIFMVGVIAPAVALVVVIAIGSMAGSF